MIAPTLSAVAGVPNSTYLKPYADLVTNTINDILIPVLLAVAFLVFLWGVANAYILHPGDEAAVKKGHKLILWGLIGFVVILTVWGIINVIVTTLNLGVGGGPIDYGIKPPTI